MLDAMMIAKGWLLSGVAVLVAEVIGNVLKLKWDAAYRQLLQDAKPSGPRSKRPPGWFGPVLLAGAVLAWPLVLALQVYLAAKYRQTVLENFFRFSDAADAKRRSQAERALTHLQIRRAGLIESRAHVQASLDRYTREIAQADRLIVGLLTELVAQTEGQVQALDKKLEDLEAP